MKTPRRAHEHFIVFTGGGNLGWDAMESPVVKKNNNGGVIQGVCALIRREEHLGTAQQVFIWWKHHCRYNLKCINIYHLLYLQARDRNGREMEDRY